MTSVEPDTRQSLERGRSESEGQGPAVAPSDSARLALDRRRTGHTPWQLRLLMWFAPRLLSGALHALAKTARIAYAGSMPELFERWRRGEQVIVAFWHNRVVMMPIPARGHQVCIMNSQSRDGEIASRALERWGIRCVRGSATRGGVGGFMQLVSAYRDGDSLAVVPDGPRGPRYVVKAGVIHLARATGAPIFAVSFAASRQRQLRSWDRLIIPLPWSRVVYVGGEPLCVPRHADADEVDRLRQELEARLNAATQSAEAQVVHDGSRRTPTR